MAVAAKHDQITAQARGLRLNAGRDRATVGCDPCGLGPDSMTGQMAQGFGDGRTCGWSDVSSIVDDEYRHRLRPGEERQRVIDGATRLAAAVPSQEDPVSNDLGRMAGSEKHRNAVREQQGLS